MQKDKSAGDPQTYAIIGAAMEVHGQLGYGFAEAVYQEALAIEFTERAIQFGKEVPLPVTYKGRLLECGYRADFICFGEVLVELKGIRMLTHYDTAQVINYLKATGLKKALLLNFGSTSLEFERIIL